MQLELRGITKRFGNVVANDHINLTVQPGEIHALLGENGAGKSTLMNVLYGLYRPDEGEIIVDNVPRRFETPTDAMAAGIGMVHQHFMLVPVFTVAENVMLGNEYTSGPIGHLSHQAAREKVRELSDRYGLDVDPDAVIEDLPVGVQQRVEILKALLRDAKTLILDEPTAVLTPQEIDELIRVMRELKKAGTSIVFITHKLREVRAVADTISIMRRGEIVGTALPTASEAELASAMVGRTVQLQVEKSAPRVGNTGLAISSLTVDDDFGQIAVNGIDLTVHGGEIVALAGVQGNGQEALVEALLGLRQPTQGSIRLGNTELAGLSPSEVLSHGVGFVPEDRLHDGIIADMTIAENLVLDTYLDRRFSRGIALQPGAIRDNAIERVAEFDIRPTDTDTLTGNMSGGNQQKVVIARELSRPLSLFIASQPTRGVDVGAQEFIHSRIVAERDRGTPVLIVSGELDEVLALADRIAVMYRGHIVGILPAGASRDELGLMMAGVGEKTALAEAEAHPTLISQTEAESSS